MTVSYNFDKVNKKYIDMYVNGGKNNSDISVNASVTSKRSCLKSDFETASF